MGHWLNWYRIHCFWGCRIRKWRRRWCFSVEKLVYLNIKKKSRFNESYSAFPSWQRLIYCLSRICRVTGCCDLIFGTWRLVFQRIGRNVKNNSSEENKWCHYNINRRCQWTDGTDCWINEWASYRWCRCNGKSLPKIG